MKNEDDTFALGCIVQTPQDINAIPFSNQKKYYKRYLQHEVDRRED